MRRLLAVMLLAAGLAGGAATQPADPVLRIALREDGDMLDPTLARTYVGRIVFAGLCDKLFDLDSKLAIVPQLATSYEWPDSRTLLLHLRAGVRFQDGTAFDAAAVKYGLDRHITMPASSRRGEIAAVDRVEVVDPLTVRLVLKAPNAPLLSQLADRAGMIVSPLAAEAEGKDFALHPVCNGPFSFVERVAQDHITLERFPGYWNAPAIHFSRVIYQPIVNSSVRLANLQSGAVDLAENITPSDVDAVRHDPRLQLFQSEALGYMALGVNVGNGPRAQGPLHDPRVRQAFSLAIDRRALVDVVYAGMYVPIDQAVPDNSPFYAASVPPPARDVGLARALLQQTGVTLPVHVAITLSNNSDTQQMGEVIQSMAAEAGFAVTLNTMEFASSLAVALRGDYDLFLNGWSGRPDADGNLWSFLHSAAPLNDTGYSNAEMDALLDKGREVTDMTQRREIYARIAEQLAVDLPHIYLYAPINLAAMTTRIRGFVPVPDGMIRLQNLTMIGASR